jgi:hypothetical protein
MPTSFPATASGPFQKIQSGDSFGCGRGVSRREASSESLCCRKPRHYHMEIYEGFILSRSCSFPVFNRKYAVPASAPTPTACVPLRNAAHWVPSTPQERRFHRQLRAVALPGGRPIVDDPRPPPYVARRWKRLVGSFPELAARSCARTGENPCVPAAPFHRGPVAVAAPARTLRESDRS